MTEIAMTSPSGDLRIVLLQRRFRKTQWQIQVRDRLIAQGADADPLVDAMRKAATRGDLYGAEVVTELRTLLDRYAEHLTTIVD